MDRDIEKLANEFTRLISNYIGREIKNTGKVPGKKNVLPAFEKVNTDSALSKIREIQKREQEKKLFYKELGKNKIIVQAHEALIIATTLTLRV